ncbi:LLM class flavin-dependent oxidoreductase [Saccharopolyspora rosea]|uniref:LLM class flavin-dependent oxidoreductase n=1 Tax=Saccharopolyspora rosea TaxID=524884 RepID=A0ABW3FXV8_9PSEU|nr:LLM class flavin-dependent oxidoreductase [Saccharopolyspora rosea]
MSKGAQRWGLLLPQGAHLELAGVDPARAWGHVLDAAAEAERLGYGSVWTIDRSETLPRREPEPVFDSWTALAAVAQRTERIGLGHLGPGAPFRDPALLAKRAATLDVMSGGRMELALEPTGHPSEHRAHGVPVPDPAVRRAALAETVEALRLLWTRQRVSSEGEHVVLDQAFSSPKPANGGIRLHVHEDAVEAVPAQAVDGVLWQAPPEVVRAGVETFRKRCEAAGADPDAVEHAVLLESRIFDTEDERDRWLATPHVVIFWSEHPDLYMRRNLVGTVDAVRDRVRAYLDAGARRFLVWFRDYPELTSARRFMSEVVAWL